LDSPWETGYNDFQINRKQFPDPEFMFRRIRELGFYPCVWLTPFVNSVNVQDMTGIEPKSTNYDEAVKKDVLITTGKGEVAATKWWKGEGGLIDFTDPAAVEWYHKELAKTLKFGVRAFKCDDGEGNLVPEAMPHDGTSVTAMKNRYTILYNKATQSYIERYLNGNGIFTIRSGFTGMQKYPIAWAGDNSANFSFSDGLPSVILACQNMAMSGVPLYGADIAGYYGNQSKELFIRWAQFSAFSPFFQIHMISNKGPWDFDRETLEIFRYFARLRVQLFPYLYNAVHEANHTGMPVIRPMALAFQDDEKARHSVYQYMFGPDILVAPMFQPGTYRNVYLPEGTWYDFWTKEACKGPVEIEVHSTLDKMPLYVRSGSIIPMLPEDVETLIPRHEDMAEDIRAIDERRVLMVWPGSRGSVETWENINASMEVNRGRTQLKLVSLQKRPLEVKLLERKVNPDVQNGLIHYNDTLNQTNIHFQTFQGEHIISWKENK
jgi:alpha-D-xyloside xylohydrolase